MMMRFEPFAELDRRDRREKHTDCVRQPHDWGSGGRSLGSPRTAIWDLRAQFHLGDGLATEQIDAGYQDGVLTISIPVAEQAKPRKITVDVADKALAG